MEYLQITTWFVALRIRPSAYGLKKVTAAEAGMCGTLCNGCSQQPGTQMWYQPSFVLCEHFVEQQFPVARAGELAWKGSCRE